MAGSTKKTRRSRKAAGRLDLQSMVTEINKKDSESKTARERLEHDALTDENTQNFEAFVRANEAIMNGMAALSSEMHDFGNKRLRENVERSESLMSCNDSEEAFRIQWDFFQSATQQYFDQTNNMLAIMAKITGDYWAPVQERTNEALRGLNKESS
jgi:hypothetical protein